MGTILIIDDDSDLRDVIAELLTLDGHEIIVAENGIHGIEQYKNHLPDLVITDLEMPRMGGAELMESLIAEFHHVPFIVISGSTNMELISQVIDLSANRLLHKPFDIDMLLEAVALLTGKVSPIA